MIDIDSWIALYESNKTAFIIFALIISAGGVGYLIKKNFKRIRRFVIEIRWFVWSYKFKYLQYCFIASLLCILLLAGGWFQIFNIYNENAGVWFQRTGSLVTILSLVAEFKIPALLERIKERLETDAFGNDLLMLALKTSMQAHAIETVSDNVSFKFSGKPESERQECNGQVFLHKI